ncbi:hypothetical protein OH76DRAFT_552592, partial [Lentinus brumalis]
GREYLLLTCLNSQTGRLTGVSNAALWWTAERFGRLVVWKLGYTWAGWPADIPFHNLSRVPEGAPTLKRLRELWDTGKLRLVPATEAERARALHDPESVLPNAANARRPEPARSFAVYRKKAALFHELASKIPPSPTPARPPSPAVERVLHPLSELKTIFVRPLDESSTSHTEPRTRRQRSDINHPRARPVTKTRPKHPKRGPHTALTFVGAASEWQGRYVFSDDRLDEYVAVDEDEGGEDEAAEEIESADDPHWD